MDSEQPSLDREVPDLGSRWEIIETGITIKLYPSCAGTHPTLDAVLDLKRRERFSSADVEAVDVAVDSVTPTVLIYDRPASGLEGKFSLPYCVAAAIVAGSVGIDSFEQKLLDDADVRALMPRVRMRVDPALDGVAAPLTEARVRITLRDGRTLASDAHGARGYFDRPASDAELASKFLSCAARALPRSAAEDALLALRGLAAAPDVRPVTRRLAAS
jgi:2-methylcitrate dehydratase PrpD